MADRAPGGLTGLPPHDLWRSDGEWYLVPTGLRLPAGSQRLVGLDGEARFVDPFVAAAFAVDEEEAQDFAARAATDGVERVTQALGALIAMVLTASGRGEVLTTSPDLETTLVAFAEGLGELLTEPGGMDALHATAREVRARLLARGEERLATAVDAFVDSVVSMQGDLG